MSDKGIEQIDCDEGSSGWYFVTEAECSADALDDLDALFEKSTTGSDISELIDQDEVDQGNSLALFNAKLSADDEKCIVDLKRKYVSPKHVADLSPRLEAVHISPVSRQSKRRLFEDSGIGNEAEDTPVQVEAHQVETAESGFETQTSTGDFVEQLLRAQNQKALLLGKFKETFGISYAELTRTFKSCKSCCQNWIVVAFAVQEDVMHGSKKLLETHCDFFQVIVCYASVGIIALYNCEFKVSKSRETVERLFNTVLNINVRLLLTDPPRIRSTPVALFFFKKALTEGNYKYGEFPAWIATQTLLSHQSATSDTFELATMIQWAYDNDYTEECEIAMNYAAAADTDPNAAAWLRSNSQVKYVKDCCHMVRLYKRQEMREMSIASWIDKCCSKVTGSGDWKPIAQFLRYQDINFVSFLEAFKLFLHGTPKKNCLVFWGESDTGKSYFCSSLIQFMHGRVINYMNSASQFWLQPLVDSKIGFLDDATYSAWKFMDNNMRNALDGNQMCVDMKHKNPIQWKMPPLLVTTNCDVKSDITFKYLHSRLTFFHFPKLVPFHPDGKPVFELTKENWKQFFIRLKTQLNLGEPEDGESS
ncbi:E1 protein [Bos taurus papillomavirus 21]|uniref:Replication protein E1 n=1 Tax=Bos taurus papillomavirus 21 TaxID=1887219 RepID=A0A1B2K250_9PAPI|nr:E1 protein [Bos taurus papillomavirus 21]ANZ90266.1 E1 protein [Bos taurus papillomavirus 21]